MITFGCIANWNNRLSDDINFAKKNGFDFLQVWYDHRGVVLNSEKNPIEALMKCDFPFIIHAVFDLNSIVSEFEKLIEILQYLKQKEIIIHPICTSENFSSYSTNKLAEYIKIVNKRLLENGITLYIENNSKPDSIFYLSDDVQYVFSNVGNVQFILDIAHIDDYDHLSKLITIKKPNLLHVADRNFNIPHEHIEIGKGNIDFKKVFTEILIEEDYRIILEIPGYDEVKRSKEKIVNILNEKKHLTTAST